MSSLCGCATDRVAIESIPADDFPSGAVSVPFVTTRKLETDKRSNSYFGDDRGASVWGRCVVELGQGGSARVNATVRGVIPEPQAAIVHQFRSTERTVVYVHGYNVGFEKGCRRAARLQRNLGVEQRLLLFSWPANGNFLSYLHDVVDLEWSGAQLEETLRNLADVLGPQNIDLLGHSLGARGLVDALARMEDGGADRFASLTLVAPDVDRDVFRRTLGALGRRAGQITVYASGNDRALQLSRRANGHPRAGQAIPGLSYPGVDLVDVTAVEVRKLSGHIYHLYNPAVVEDLRRVLGTGRKQASFVRVPTAEAFELVPVKR